MKMTTTIACSSLLTLLVATPAASAQKEWMIESFVYPGATITQGWSSNNKLQVAANTVDTSFIYDSKSGGVIDVTVPDGYSSFSLFFVTNSGAIFGSGIEDGTGKSVGLLISANGDVTTIDHPDSAGVTQARGLSRNGIVAGFYQSTDEIFPGVPALVAFSYNSDTQEFSSFVPSLRTIAQGVNADGYVVGDAMFLPENNPCNENAVALEAYGFVRSPEGDITYFQVNGNGAAARDISNNGTIVGWTRTPGSNYGFTASLPIQNCTSLSIPSEDLFVVPDSQATYLQYVSESGNVLSGNAIDASGNIVGFIATR